MTVIISIKVNEGVVLAADSSSLVSENPHEFGGYVANIFNNAKKLTHLHKDLPIGVLSWGKGIIGRISTSMLVKDFGKLIISSIDMNNYLLKDVSERFKEYVSELYEKEMKNTTVKSEIGFVIAGYSSNKGFAEEWWFETNMGGEFSDVLEAHRNSVGMIYRGYQEAIDRLYLGVSCEFGEILHKFGFGVNEISKIVNELHNRSLSKIAYSVMDIQNAIDFAEFLLNVSEGYSKFVVGPDWVRSPMEIAAITKHEGFKWVKHKTHYS